LTSLIYQISLTEIALFKTVSKISMKFPNLTVNHHCHRWSIKSVWLLRTVSKRSLWNFQILRLTIIAIIEQSNSFYWNSSLQDCIQEKAMKFPNCEGSLFVKVRLWVFRVIVTVMVKMIMMMESRIGGRQ